MDDIWAALIRYKLAEEKLKELKLKVWENMPIDTEIELSLKEAEEDLDELKALIEMNYGPMKVD